MDLLGTIRKSGSRGGVNFSWDEVANSSHRENYLGHSLKAPVGRWQKGKDLNWYASAEATPANAGETDEERLARERKEELRRIKEAEEDAIARTLGLPPPQRDTSGANAIEVGKQRQIGPASGTPATGEGERDSKLDSSRQRDRDERREKRRHRSRSYDMHRGRNGNRHQRHHSRERHPERPRDRSRERQRRDGDERRHRSERKRSRSRSADRRHRRRRDDRTHGEEDQHRRGSRKEDREQRRDNYRERSRSPRGERGRD